jgi:hypothetical protein
MNSGKSTLLGLLSLMLPRALSNVDITEATLFRAIAKWQPTLIVDEADILFKDKPPLRAVVNSGWTRGSGVLRCHPETLEPELFPTFSPKAIGMKGKGVPDTTLSRSIQIEMLRKKSDERTDSFEHTEDDELLTIRRQLARWAADNMEMLTAGRPTMPDGFQNRLAANWRPLLAIADLVGGRWPAFARKAAVALSPADQGSIGTTLLADIKAVFDETKRDPLSSEDIVNALHTMEGRPWAEWGRMPKPITKNQLATLLRPFGISSRTIRDSSGTPKGYHRSFFEEAWDRYLATGTERPEDTPPPTPHSETPQRHNADGIRASGAFRNATNAAPETDVAFRNCEKPLQHSDCGVVAFEKPLRGSGVLCAQCGAPGDDRDGSPPNRPGRTGMASSGCIDYVPRSGTASGTVTDTPRRPEMYAHPRVSTSPNFGWRPILIPAQIVTHETNLPWRRDASEPWRWGLK